MLRMRIELLVTVGALVVSAPGQKTVRAQDFERMLGRAVERELRGSLDPRRLEQALARPAQHGEPFVIKSADGWMLVAHRYKPTGPARPDARPVILCHGLTYNAVFWDLDPSCSLAEYLSGRGYDVWAVSLRGCGLSQKWVWKLDDAPVVLIGGALRRMSHGKLGPTGFATVEPKFAHWTMDDHIAYDVPAFVHLVRRQTGANQVIWIGHSMGGIVALAHLARFPNPGIARLVTVGSQVTMSETQLPMQVIAAMIQNRQRQLAGQLTGKAIFEETKSGVHNLFFNVPNTDPKVYEALSGGWATDIPSIGLMQQYLLLATRGELLDARGQFNYARAIGQIQVPVLIACGAQDRFAPPAVQRYLHEHIGSADKTLVVFGRAQGFAVDAGHDDALVGLTSREQVYPFIARWLADRP